MPIICCNPFNDLNHKNLKYRSLRKMTKQQLIETKIKKKETKSTLYICSKCTKIINKKIAAKKINLDEKIENTLEMCKNDSDLDSDLETKHSIKTIVQSDSLKNINRSLVLLNDSPIKKRKLNQIKYSKLKSEKVCKTIKKDIFNITNSESDSDSDLNIMLLEKLKKKFTETSNKEKKIEILTLFSDIPPKHIKKHFDASDYLIQTAKKVCAEKGVLESPSSVIERNRLSSSTKKIIQDFYDNDEVSRIMPGKNDIITVWENSTKHHKQKRLVLGNLKEIYQLFKNQFPEEKIGFSKFAEMRPKHCVLAGSPGTHTICLCTTHQNFKLLVDCLQNYKVLDKSTSYKDCITKIICEKPNEDCYFKRCTHCPGVNELIQNLKLKCEESGIEKVKYKQWVCVDRANLEHLESDINSFLDKFASALEKLISHSYISEQQSSFFTQRKENLAEDEIIVSVDFSENYSFIYQDSIQGVHWNNDQVTVHPYVLYFKENNLVVHKSFVAISEILNHDAVTWRIFQTKIVQYIKENYKFVKTIIYFSDGACSQYKNKKNFINLTHHESDFGLKAEWNFFATAHGKGPCDGVGGTVKRLATRYCLQHPSENIRNTIEFYNWAVSNIKNITFFYFASHLYNLTLDNCIARFNSAVTIKGTQKFHRFLPIDNNKMLVKETSNSESHTIVIIKKRSIIYSEPKH